MPVKLLTSGGGGVNLVPSSSIASDQTMYLPTSGTSGGTVLCTDSTGGTANGVLYLNGSKQVTSGSGLVFDSSGNLGIGTSSPTSRLTLSGKGTGAWLTINRTDSGSNIIDFTQSGSRLGYVGYIGSDLSILQAGAANISFLTNNYERMRLDSSGNLLVGTTSPVYPLLKLSCYQSAAHHVGGFKNGSDGYGILFLGNTDGIGGSITWSNVSCAYTTSSDYRLKEDYKPVADAIARLNQLKPVNFAWKVDGSRCDGFLAHELQEVIPEAATGHKDEMRTEEYEVTPAVKDEEGNVITEAVMGEREVPVYQGIDQSKIVPLLTAALQEAVAKIESLTQRIEALEYTK